MVGFCLFRPSVSPSPVLQADLQEEQLSLPPSLPVLAQFQGYQPTVACAAFNPSLSLQDCHLILPSVLTSPTKGLCPLG